MCNHNLFLLSQAQVLEQDTNIEAYPTTTGNVAH
jgi:hypothetical protein